MPIKHRILSKLNEFKVDTNHRASRVFLGRDEYREYCEWVEFETDSTIERFVENDFNVAIEHQSLAQSEITVCG